MQGGARPAPSWWRSAVADAIDNAVAARCAGESATTPNLILSARSTLGDEEFENALRGLSWYCPGKDAAGRGQASVAVGSEARELPVIKAPSTSPHPVPGHRFDAVHPSRRKGQTRPRAFHVRLDRPALRPRQRPHDLRARRAVAQPHDRGRSTFARVPGARRRLWNR